MASNWIGAYVDISVPLSVENVAKLEHIRETSQADYDHFINALTELASFAAQWFFDDPEDVGNELILAPHPLVQIISDEPDD